MSILRISEFDESHKHCLFIIMTKTTVEQVIKSWKNCDIRLNEGINYKCIYLDLSTFIISFVTISSDSLPYDEFLLPMFPDTDGSNFDLESLKNSSMSLKVTHDPRPEQYISIDINYEIDNEPLVHYSCDKQSIDPQNESMLSDAYCAKIENFEILLEKEERLRKIAEDRLIEMLESYENLLENSRKNEEKLRASLETHENQKNENLKTIQNLQKKLNDSEYNSKKLEDLLNLTNLKLKVYDYQVLKEDYQSLKKLYEKSEKKLQEMISKLENNEEGDPITLLLKEKEETILKKNQKIQDLSQQLLNLKPPSENNQVFSVRIKEIESKLKERNLEFKREEDLVYSINGVKLSVTLKESSLVMRKLSNFYSPSEIVKIPHHSRSKTENKSLLNPSSHPAVKIIQSPTRSRLS